MKPPSLKINYLLNFLRVFSSALAGIITLPYLNRVLGVENMGKIEYVFTIINYFVLFSALGIPMYGIREVSKRRNDTRKTGILVYELLLILAITTIISYVCIFGLLIHLPNFSSYKSLLIVMSGMIFLSNIGAEWYFQGTENQKFITIRYVVVRIIIFCLIFLLIKSAKDYTVYAFLWMLLLFGANIVNFIYLVLKFKKEKIHFRELNISQHWKPVLTVFIATIAVNIYLQLDYFLIGSLLGDKYVGYYALANKLVRYVLSFITIIGSVVLPRLAFLYIDDKEKYYYYLRKSFDAIMLLAIPASVYFFVFSRDIIFLMGGKEFLPTVSTLQILSPLCIIVSIAYFMGFLIAYPQGLEKIYTKATVVSAVFSVLVNFFAIRYFQQNGAAVVALLSEFIAIVIMIYLLKDKKEIKNIFNLNILKIVGVGAFMLSISLVFGGFLAQNFQLHFFLLYSVVFWCIYFLVLLLLKEDVIFMFSKTYFKYKEK